MPEDKPVMWRPIETAPKDGDVLLLTVHEFVTVGSYSEDGEPGFYDSEFAYVDAVYWQPKPDLPKKETENSPAGRVA